MVKKQFYKYFIIMLALFVTIYRQEPFALTAKEMVKKSDDLMRGDTLSGKYKMTVIRPKWKRTLKITAYNEGRDKTFIKILSPTKEKGITTLRIKNNMWIYHPKIERTIKIPPSMMFQPWMGSDFTNDDLVKESSIVNDYTHAVLAVEDINGYASYKIKLTPKPQAAVTWGKIILWVRKDGYVPLKEEYYNEKGKLIKTLNYSNIKHFSDRNIPSLWEMTSRLKPKNKTIIEVLEADYNKPVSEDIFTLNNLRSE